MIATYETSDRLKQCALRDSLFAQTSVGEFLSDLTGYDARIGVEYKFRRKYWRELVHLAQEHFSFYEAQSLNISSSPVPIQIHPVHLSNLDIGSEDAVAAIEGGDLDLISQSVPNSEIEVSTLRALVEKSDSSARLRSIAEKNAIFDRTSSHDLMANLSFFRMEFKNIKGFKDETWFELKDLVMTYNRMSYLSDNLDSTATVDRQPERNAEASSEDIGEYGVIPDFLRVFQSPQRDANVNLSGTGNREGAPREKQASQTSFFIPAQQTLRRMIEIRGASARLSNCVERENIFAEVTVEQFLADREDYEKRFQALWAFGATTRRELRALAIDFAMETPTAVSSSAACAGSANPNEGGSVHAKAVLRDDVRALSIRELVVRQGASVRLTNCMHKEHEATSLTIGDYLEDAESFRIHVCKIPAFGRGTFSELTKVIDGILKAPRSYKETAHGSSSAERGEIGTVFSNTEQSAAAIIKQLPDIADSELRGWLLARIAELPDNRRAVIERRYGLKDGKTETLEEIAKTVHVTRERVRQVERDGLRKLRLRNGSENAKRFLKLIEADAWDHLSQKRPLVTEEDLRARKAELEPLFHLAVDLVHEGLPTWINEYAKKTFGGWMSPWVDQDEVLVLRRGVPAVIREIALPCPLERIADSCLTASQDYNSLTVALLLTDGVTIHDGYVCRGTVGATTKRAIALHRLSQTMDAAVFDISALANCYRQQNPDDLVSSRVIRNAFSENPHLFGCLYDNTWFRIPLGSRRLATMMSAPTEADLAIEQEYSDGSAGNWLVRLLSERGPMRMTEILEEAKQEDSEEYALNSLGPIMLMSPCFERSANGIFALANATSSHKYFSHSPAPAFLSEAHCRMVAYAKHGEGYWRLFPSWTEAYAYHLCCWAKQNASREVFRSLLSVVDPDLWDIAAMERQSWLDAKRHFGDWQIGLLRKAPLGNAFPRPRDLLPCLLFLSTHGKIGWLAAARAATLEVFLAAYSMVSVSVVESCSQAVSNACLM